MNACRHSIDRGRTAEPEPLPLLIAFHRSDRAGHKINEKFQHTMVFLRRTECEVKGIN